eukprot:m.259912 g.259912  ORF g.259912 m.259912 type:complete len:113 (-) comp26774_c0_seq62:1866-2204(-)
MRRKTPWILLPPHFVAQINNRNSYATIALTLQITSPSKPRINRTATQNNKQVKNQQKTILSRCLSSVKLCKITTTPVIPCCLLTAFAQLFFVLCSPQQLRVRGCQQNHHRQP